LVTAVVIELHLVDLRSRHRLALTLRGLGRLGGTRRRVLTCRILAACRLLVTSRLLIGGSTLLILGGLRLVRRVSRLRLLVFDRWLARHAVLHLRLIVLLEMHLRLLSLLHIDISLL